MTMFGIAYSSSTDRIAMLKYNIVNNVATELLIRKGPLGTFFTAGATQEGFIMRIVLTGVSVACIVAAGKKKSD